MNATHTNNICDSCSSSLFIIENQSMQDPFVDSLNEMDDNKACKYGVVLMDDDVHFKGF